MITFILFTVGNIILAASGLNLNCTNDFENVMSCHLDALNCAEHSMTLYNTEENSTVTHSFTGPRTKSCAFGQCASGCCCTMKMLFIIGETFKADVYKGGQSVHSETISILETIKPQTPNIISVKESNGNYLIQWKSNTKRSLLDDLEAIVTYQIKGGNKKTSKNVKLNTMSDINNFEILGHNLEPSTIYVVSVKTYTIYGVFSDSSSEVEFKTAPSRNGVVIAVLLCLSVVAILVSGVAFASFIKLKGKLWDKAAKEEKPKPLDIQTKKNQRDAILMPEPLSINPLSVEPLVSKVGLTLSKESLADSCGRSGQTSGISTGSSHFSYANTEPVDIEACVLEAINKALPMLAHLPAVNPSGLEEPCSVNPPDVTETPPHPIVFVNECYNCMNDSGYHSSEGPPLQDFIISPAVSSVIETDMSYQSFTKSDDNLLMTSSGASSGLSADSHSFLPVVYGYQDFEKLIEQCNSVSSEHKGEECLSLIRELTDKANTAEDDLSHMSSVPATLSNEFIVDYDYHCI